MNIPRLVMSTLTAALSAAGLGLLTRSHSAEITEGPSPLRLLGNGVGRNMANPTVKNLPAEWSVEAGKQKNVKWAAKLGTRAYAGAVVAGGKVFIATNREDPAKGGVLKCLRAADGQLLWQALHEELPQEITKDGINSGVAATPAVEGNRLYYVNNRGEVICADTEGFHDGKNDGVQDEPAQGKTDADVVWRLDMLKELDVYPHKVPACSPLVVGDLLFVTTCNGVDEETVRSPKAPSFIAVDKRTGKVKWTDNSPGDKIILGQWSNPAYAEVNGKGQVIFGGGDGWLRAFEPQTGKPIWQFDCNPKAAKTGPRGGRNYLVSTPVVYDNKVYVGVGQEPGQGVGPGHLWCVDLTKTGDVSPVNDNFDPKAEANKGSALVWHLGGPIPKGGDRDYAFYRTVGACAIHDGLLYASDIAGYLYCLDAATGKQHWVHDMKAEVWASPYYADGKVYQATKDGDVHVLAHGKELKPLGKIEMNEAISCAPVAADGVLYVVTDKNLYAIAAK